MEKSLPLHDTNNAPCVLQGEQKQNNEKNVAGWQHFTEHLDDRVRNKITPLFLVFSAEDSWTLCENPVPQGFSCKITGR